jgi:RND family efflux transporter MFP subunit
MKRLLILIVSLICAGLVGFLLIRNFRPASKPTDPAEKQLYTCGMHPQIIQDKPGDCPICGMKLQPVRKQTGQSPNTASTQASPSSGERKIKYYKSSMTPGETSKNPGKDSMGMEMVPVYDEAETTTNATITVDPVTIQTMGVRVGEVTEGPLKRSVRTVGVVDFNETTLTDVTTKFKGWIEKLFVDATGRVVKKGEPLFETYSPDVYNSELEFASLTRSGNTALAKTTLERLSLLDVATTELDKLKTDAQPSRTITMFSPADGVVIEKTAVEGMMFEPGMNLYRLADLSIVWLKAQIYEQDMAFVQLGQEAVASIDSFPGQKFLGRVTYVYPTLDPKTRTAQVRMEFHNPGLLLKPGMFAKVELEAQISPSVTLVPEIAVLRSGDRATVFVALDGGKFDPREVILGPRDSSAHYQVLQGVSPGEKVVTSAQFMFDSESQLREAIQKMLNPDEKSRPGSVVQPAEMPAMTPPASPAAPKTFICPMPEHANIEYEHGGKCPVCGMTLIPGSAIAKPAATPTPATTNHAPGNH